MLRLESLYFLAQNAQIWTFGLEIFENQFQTWNQHLRNWVWAKFCLDKKVDTYWPKISKFGHLDLKFIKQKPAENSRFPQFWNFGSFRVVSQYYWVALAGFGTFRLVSAGFGWFQLVPGFSKDASPIPVRQFKYFLSLIPIYLKVNPSLVWQLKVVQVHWFVNVTLQNIWTIYNTNEWFW